MVKYPRLKKILGRIYIYLILLIMYLPILVLMVFSFSPSDTLGNWDEGFSFELYGRLFKRNLPRNRNLETRAAYFHRRI